VIKYRKNISFGSFGGKINYIWCGFIISGYRRSYEEVSCGDGFGGVCCCRVR
jgi:hypothetical protein